VSPLLTGLSLADAPAQWAQLGFGLTGDTVPLGAARLRLGAPGRGIVSWSLWPAPIVGDLDGLATEVAPGPPPPEATHHRNGAVGLDHVVVLTPDFDRTSAALDAAGMALRRIRHVEAGDFRQGFRRLGPAILELVEARDVPAGPARFWGLVVIVSDLEALAAQLGDRLGPIKSAVQPGRRIATLRREAGLSAAVAFMDPEP
jgi:hypothetical protein